MTCSDWVLIGTTATLAAIALFVPFLSEWIKRRLFAPKLQLSFIQSPPFCRFSPRRVSDPTSINIPNYDFHIVVENIGKSQARKVEVLIDELWIFDVSDESHKVDNFLPINLRYDRQGTQFLDINPDRRIPWNLGFISMQLQERLSGILIDIRDNGSGELRFILDLLEFPFNQPNCLLPGKYQIHISLYSENADSDDMLLIVNWTGSWRDREQDMFREIVISEV